jgi:hypothetical protein
MYDDDPTRRKQERLQSSGKSLKTTSSGTEFEPQVLEDTDETAWAFIGGVQPPKAQKKS